MFFFFFSSRRRHTRWNCDWSSDVCSSDLARATLDRLAGFFGRFGVYAELRRALGREEETQNEWLRAEAERLGLPLLASNAPLMTDRGERALLDTLTCIRHGVTIAQAGRQLAHNSERFLKSSRE